MHVWYIFLIIAILDLLCLAAAVFGMRAQDPSAGLFLLVFFVLTALLLFLVGTWLIYTGAKGIWKDFNNDL